MNLIKIIESEIRYLVEDYSKINKSNIYKILDDYSIEDDHIDHYYGQDVYQARLYKKNSDELLANIDYVIYEKELTISYIESYVKGKGYGKILMIYLAKKYGYDKLERSSLTPSGVKMRKELDKLFDFNYEDHIKSQNKLIKNSEIEKISNDYIGTFLKDLIENGNDAWGRYRGHPDIIGDYDLNDIAEIAQYVEKSKLSSGYSTEEPPEYITDLLDQLKK